MHQGTGLRVDQIAHPLQKELAVHMLDGIEAEASTACGLTSHPSTACDV
jgi:hypothetical protein